MLWGFPLVDGKLESVEREREREFVLSKKWKNLPQKCCTAFPLINETIFYFSFPIHPGNRQRQMKTFYFNLFVFFY